jgi:DNA-directed RNA polymerase omega subunit
MTVLTQIPDSQFAYVVVVARRARQLMINGRPMVDNPRARKTTRIAEEELLLGLLEYELPFVETPEEKEQKRRKS